MRACILQPNHKYPSFGPSPITLTTLRYGRVGKCRDLTRIQRERKTDEGFRRFVYSFQPYLIVLRDLSSLLLLYMRPYTAETGLMWGLMHLTISASYPTKRQGAIKHQDLDTIPPCGDTRQDTAMPDIQHFKNARLRKRQATPSCASGYVYCHDHPLGRDQRDFENVHKRRN